VDGLRAPENGRERPLKLSIFGAAPTPESAPVGHVFETEHLLDAPVAVGRHDEDLPRERACVRHAHHDVVVKLALLPVIEQLVPAVVRADLIEEAPQREAPSEELQRCWYSCGCGDKSSFVGRHGSHQGRPSAQACKGGRSIKCLVYRGRSPETGGARPDDR
jgi:hypothetical protein